MSHRGGGTNSGTATVLFSDVVGSTEQRVALGDVRADELRRRHDAALRSVIERHGGTVVKSLGDGLMATFEGASDGRGGRGGPPARDRQAQPIRSRRRTAVDQGGLELW